MGIEDAVREYLMSRNRSWLIIGSLASEPANSFEAAVEKEFFEKYRRTIGLAEHHVLPSLRDYVHDVIRDAETQPNTVLADWQIESAVIAPLKQMVNESKQQYTLLRTQRVPEDEAFDAATSQIGYLLQALQAWNSLNLTTPYLQVLEDYAQKVGNYLRSLAGKGMSRVND